MDKLLFFLSNIPSRQFHHLRKKTQITRSHQTSDITDEKKHLEYYTITAKAISTIDHTYNSLNQTYRQQITSVCRTQTKTYTHHHSTGAHTQTF